MKRPNLRIIGIEEEEVQLKVPENFFNKIIEEKFPNLKKEMPIKVQEAHRNTRQTGLENKVSLPHNNQNNKHTEERKNIKRHKGKSQVTYKGRLIRITPDLSM